MNPLGKHRRIPAMACTAERFVPLTSLRFQATGPRPNSLPLAAERVLHPDALAVLIHHHGVRLPGNTNLGWPSHFHFVADWSALRSRRTDFLGMRAILWSYDAIRKLRFWFI
jgi:hypothetical protein